MGVRSLALMSVLALAAPTAVIEAQEWAAPGAQQAYNEGYQRGARAGEEDSRRGESFNFSDESDYRRADLGYRREYGSADWYRGQFRRGFELGYRDGYSRFGIGRRGNPPPWSNGRGRAGAPGQYDRRYDGQYDRRYDLAYSTGFNDGYEAGLRDARDRRRFDPIGEGRYRSADHGYERWYGSREVYKLNYREAFRSGYERGFNDGRRYGTRQWWWPF